MDNDNILIFLTIYYITYCNAISIPFPRESLYEFLRNKEEEEKISDPLEISRYQQETRLGLRFEASRGVSARRIAKSRARGHPRRPIKSRRGAKGGNFCGPPRLIARDRRSAAAGGGGGGAAGHVARTSLLSFVFADLQATRH